MNKKIGRYVFSILATLAVGGLSALLTSGNMQVYSEAVQPKLAPPAIWFPIVWSVLYVLMGIGRAMVVSEKEVMPDAVAAADRVYWSQLAINFLWSIIFFNFRGFLFAFLWLILLLAAVVLMTARFAPVSRTAAYLQFPYIAWIVFAGYLNFMIFLLN